MLSIFDIYLAPIETDKRIRQRIESAIAKEVYQLPTPLGTFLAPEIRYLSRRIEEIPIRVTMSFNNHSLSLSQEFMA